MNCWCCAVNTAFNGRLSGAHYHCRCTQGKSQQGVLVREVRAREHGVAADDSHENRKRARQSLRDM